MCLFLLFSFLLLAGWNVDMKARTQVALWSMRQLWEWSPWRQNNEMRRSRSPDLGSRRLRPALDRVSLDFNMRENETPLLFSWCYWGSLLFTANATHIFRGKLRQSPRRNVLFIYISLSTSVPPPQQLRPLPPPSTNRENFLRLHLPRSYYSQT